MKEMSNQFSIKYRPTVWGEVRGHKKIVNDLKTRSFTKDWPRVLLFSGQSGVGKDSLAFLVAKTVNCSNPILKKDDNNIEYYDPCNKCLNCKSVNDQSWRGDVQFIDCSSTSKDEIINLRNISQTSTMFGGDKRIFIIDEFQAMVNSTTKQAFLTLLENPSSSSIFIFTTMEIGKVPTAIKSGRAQHYQLLPLSLEDLSDIVFDIVEKDTTIKVEDIFYDDDLGAMKNILEMAEGSARHLLAIFERVVYGKLFKAEDLKDAFSAPPQAKLFDILLKLATKKSEVLIDLQSYPSLDEFFYLSYETLTESIMFSLTNITKAYWKEKLYKQLVSSVSLNTLQALLIVYNDIYETVSKSEVKGTYILSKLISFLLEGDRKLEVEVPTVKTSSLSRRVIK